MLTAYDQDCQDFNINLKICRQEPDEMRFLGSQRVDWAIQKNKQKENQVISAHQEDIALYCHLVADL